MKTIFFIFLIFVSFRASSETIPVHDENACKGYVEAAKTAWKLVSEQTGVNKVHNGLDLAAIEKMQLEKGNCETERVLRAAVSSSK